MKTVYLLTILPLYLLCACCTQKQIVFQDKEVIKHRIDTLMRYDRDSIFVAQFQKGDTVFSIKYVEKWKFKDRITIKTDTISNTLIEYKHTESNVIPRWCWWVLAIFIGEVVIGVVWLYFKLKP